MDRLPQKLDCILISIVSYHWSFILRNSPQQGTKHCSLPVAIPGGNFSSRQRWSSNQCWWCHLCLCGIPLGTVVEFRRICSQSQQPPSRSTKLREWLWDGSKSCWSWVGIRPCSAHLGARGRMWPANCLWPWSVLQVCRLYRRRVLWYLQENAWSAISSTLAFWIWMSRTQDSPVPGFNDELARGDQIDMSQGQVVPLCPNCFVRPMVENPDCKLSCSSRGFITASS